MRIALAIALLCLTATSIEAQKLDTIKVKIKRGDTLELLAAEYYGDRQHAVFIMKANRMTHPRKLRLTPDLVLVVLEPHLWKVCGSRDWLGHRHAVSGRDRRSALDPLDQFAAGLLADEVEPRLCAWCDPGFVFVGRRSARITVSVAE